MNDITIYVIDSDGRFIYKRVGSIEMTMLAVETENEQYTLQPPPDFSQSWKWDGKDWGLDEE